MKKSNSAKNLTVVSEANEQPEVAETSRQKTQRGEFPIVGMGASARGLEALENFFKHVPPASGLAFVIVQHLDPTHTSILDELLQRCAAMKVSQVEEETFDVDLQAKADESNAANNDMRNLLECTEIATVFLDNSLKVRRFTESANKVIKLSPTDVGRPITDLVTNLIYPDFESDVRKVLGTLVSVDKSLVTHNEKCFATRLMPYRTIDNRIDGVVITFTDLSRAMKIAAEARSQFIDVEKGIVK